MLKKLGVSALLIASLSLISAPAANAQNGYYRGDAYSQRDRDWDRHERREWREREWRRADERRERQWLANEWREREWRDRDRCNRGYYYPGYRAGSSFYFQYGR